jgi:hypothetical protein
MSLLRTHLNNGKTIRGSWNLQIGDTNWCHRNLVYNTFSER